MLYFCEKGKHMSKEKRGLFGLFGSKPKEEEEPESVFGSAAAELRSQDIRKQFSTVRKLRS